MSGTLSFTGNGPVVICGAGVGGCAAALALQQAGIPVAVYERDAGPDVRRQGYGMTLQVTNVLRDLGVLEDVIAANTTSLEHWTFTRSGEVLGYFGRQLGAATAVAKSRPDSIAAAVPGNIRIPRDILRRIFLSRLAPGTVTWGRRIASFECRAGGRGVDITFCPSESPEGSSSAAAVATAAPHAVGASVLIGADGIHSQVRTSMPGAAAAYVAATAAAAASPAAGVPMGAAHYADSGTPEAVVAAPLRYMGVVLVLGLSSLQGHPLLDRRGFYSVDGRARLFTMPYAEAAGAAAAAAATAAEHSTGAATAASSSASNDAPSLLPPRTTLTMWQLSFAEPDAERAAAFAALAPDALVTQALTLCGMWHDPVPALLRATQPGVAWATMLCDHGEEGRPSSDVCHAPGEAGARTLTCHAPGEAGARTLTCHAPGKLRPGSAELRRWEASGAGPPPLSCVALLGDAAHPMSPFKGQGANQALRDALLLAACLGRCRAADPARGPRQVASALTQFEATMRARAGAKVLASREAALLLHSPAVLQMPREVSGLPARVAAALLDEAAVRGIGASLGARLLPVLQELCAEVTAKLSAEDASGAAVAAGAVTNAGGANSSSIKRQRSSSTASCPSPSGARTPSWPPSIVANEADQLGPRPLLLPVASATHASVSAPVQLDSHNCAAAARASVASASNSLSAAARELPAVCDRWTLLYYCYFDVSPEQRAELCGWLEAHAAQHGVRGRVRVGLDGLNAAVGGTRAALEAHAAAVAAHPFLLAARVPPIDFKFAPSAGPRSAEAVAGSCFGGFVAKPCSEIVTLNCEPPQPRGREGLSRSAAKRLRRRGGSVDASSFGGQGTTEAAHAAAPPPHRRAHWRNAGAHLSPAAFHAALLRKSAAAPEAVTVTDTSPTPAAAAPAGPTSASTPSDPAAAAGVTADVLIDVRNGYETDVGRLIPPPGVTVLVPGTRTFAEMPGWFDAHADELRGRTVLMYCTGGVRCERASAYLREKGPGFENVFQLAGGIQRYMEAAEAGCLPRAAPAAVPPGSKTAADAGNDGSTSSSGGGSLWAGRMFVFDERPAVALAASLPLGQQTQTQQGSSGSGPLTAVASVHIPAVLGRCVCCGCPWDTYAWLRCASCGVLVLVCDSCKAPASDTATASASHRILSCTKCAAAAAVKAGGGGAASEGTEVPPPSESSMPTVPTPPVY